MCSWGGESEARGLSKCCGIEAGQHSLQIAYIQDAHEIKEELITKDRTLPLRDSF